VRSNHRQQLFGAPKMGRQSHEELVTTLRATAKSRALILREPRSACGSATSKRTLSSTETKLIMLPCDRASSDSVTVRTDCPFAIARISASRALSAWPMKRIWYSRDRLAAAHATHDDCALQDNAPFHYLLQFRASSSAPITPMVKGLSGLANAFGGHSTNALNL